MLFMIRESVMKNLLSESSFNDKNMPGKRNIALVLSSGGARGNAHIGAIREIIDRGYTISSISGTSMGALVGGVYATGKLDEFEEWMCSLHKKDVFSLMDFTFSKNGFVMADKVFNEIKKFIPDQLIEELPIPFTVVATDLKQKKAVSFSEGSLFDAIRASVAIPFVITPLSNETQVLVDGGLIAPVPVRYVKRISGDLLVAVNVNSSIPNSPVSVFDEKATSEKLISNKHVKLFKEKLNLKTHPDNEQKIGFFEFLTKTTNLLVSQLSELIIEINPPDILINISREACESYDFFKASEIIRTGRQAARQAFEDFEK